MLVDSHCHLNFPELRNDLDNVVSRMQAAEVSHALCVAVNLEELPGVLAIAERFPNIYASVGVHPDQVDCAEPDVAQLVRLAQHPRVVAIGETGLDFYRDTENIDRQRERFRTHIRAARACGKPLIVHTRAAAEDTICIMRDEGAAEVGGVMHCFTETLDVATRAMELGFYVSFSGIVTFKNAGALREVVAEVPQERLLVETDSPYLAPVPHRGKTNEPSFVRFVAEEVSRIKKQSIHSIIDSTSSNFFELFQLPERLAEK